MFLILSTLIAPWTACNLVFEINRNNTREQTQHHQGLRLPLNSMGQVSKLEMRADDGVVIKNLPTNAGDIRDVDSIPGWGGDPGGGHGNPRPILAWRIPWTEEPGWLRSIRSHRVGHN